VENVETRVSEKDRLAMLATEEDVVELRTGRDLSAPSIWTGRSLELVPSLDQAVLDEIASLQDPDEPDLLAEVIGGFLSTSGTRIARLGISWQTGNSLDVLHEAHALTGSAGIIGASRLVELLRCVEKAVVAADRVTTAALMDDLIHEYSRVEFALQQMLREDEMPGR
jgi:HPt (histidine-containing phosphotransfer) domain-containing protein